MEVKKSSARSQGEYGNEDQWVHLTRHNAVRVASAIITAIGAIDRIASAPCIRLAERGTEQSPTLLTFIEDKEVPSE